MGLWSGSFAGDADNPELEVEALRIDPGEIWAIVQGCEVTITAHAIPARIWRAKRRVGQLEQEWRAACSPCTGTTCCKRTGANS